MGPDRRNRVSEEGLTHESPAIRASLNFIVESYVPPVPFSQYVHEKAPAHAGTLVRDDETITHSMTPVFEVANSAATDRVTSILDLHTSPPSLAHVFPFMNSSSPASQSEPEGKKLVSTLGQFPPVPLRRPHVHRTSTGKLTTIGSSPLCQEGKTSLLEKEDKTGGGGLVYAGYRIWNKPPKLWDKAYAEEMVVLSGLEAALKSQESGYGFDIELPPDEPGPAGIFNLVSPSDDDASDGTCLFEHDSKQIFANHGEQSFANRLTFQFPKQITGLNITYTPSIRLGPYFNRSLKNELKIKTDMARRPIPPNCRDLARLQFKNRIGPMWNLANKDLEELYLHATILHESEFLDLIFCEKDEVQTWLQTHSFGLTYRSQKHYYKAIDVLKNAGIPPCEINQEVLDIFEWMTEQEQADFVKGYRKLCSRVKSSQEGLHLTLSEMEHFSRLSVAGQYDFINEYKARREEFERTARLDTETSIVQCPRTCCESDKTPRKSASAENFHRKFLQSGLGQKEDTNSAYSSSATHLSSHLSTSPVMTRSGSRIDSASAQKTRRRATTITDDKRARYCLLNMPTSMLPQSEDDPRMSGEFLRNGKTPTSSLYVERGSDSSNEEHFIDNNEHLGPVDEEATNVSKETTQNKICADIAEENLKLEVDDEFPNTVPDNDLQDIDQFATSLPDEVLKCENDYKNRVESGTESKVGSMCSQPVLERSRTKEWFGEHPGAKLTIPTPPPTEHSAESVTNEQSTGNDSALTSLCLKHTLSGTTVNSIPLGTKFEPAAFCVDGCHHILTQDHETCSLHVDAPNKRTISYLTPPRLLYPSIRGCSMRGSPSGSSQKNGLKDNFSEKSPRRLREKVSTLFSSLRSRRSLGALKDVK